MTDYLGKELQIGDTVVIIENNYRNFQTGNIISLNKVKATIAVITTKTYRPSTTTRYYRDIIKVIK